MTGVVGRAELLSALFLLWSLLSYARGRWLPAVLLTLLAHGCKETGLLGFPLFIWMELACPSLVRQPPGGWPGPCRRSSLRCAASVLLLCAHVLLRVHLLDGETTPKFTFMDNPLWFAENRTAQALGTMQVHWEYTRLLLWPAELSCDYSPKCLSDCAVVGPCVLKPLLAYTGALGLVGWALLRHRRHPGSLHEGLPLLALGFTAVTIAPGSHLFLRLGLLVAERLLYVPSMGVCMLCGWGAATVLGQHGARRGVRYALLSALALVVATAGWRCFVRNADWRDADTLYAAALRVCPQSARINNNVGTRLLRGRKAAKAIPFFDAAVTAVPTFALALHNRGLAVRTRTGATAAPPMLIAVCCTQSYMTGDKRDAVEWYRRSLLTPDTSNAMAYNNLGIALKDLGIAEESRAAFARAKALGHT